MRSVFMNRGKSWFLSKDKDGNLCLMTILRTAKQKIEKFFEFSTTCWINKLSSFKDLKNNEIAISLFLIHPLTRRYTNKYFSVKFLPSKIDEARLRANYILVKIQMTIYSWSKIYQSIVWWRKITSTAFKLIKLK